MRSAATQGTPTEARVDTLAAELARLQRHHMAGSPAGSPARPSLSWSR